jgi:predicted 3-demethylubiquinone-9 3-methyltransferase (glyoxalase superfamily)
VIRISVTFEKEVKINTMQKITTFLWFDKEAEEAMNFYVDVFNSAPHSEKNSKVNHIARYEKGSEAPGAEEMEGKVITGELEIVGQRFMCLDGGPIFKFNESVSLYVDCKDQAEVDYFWETFTKDGGEESQCGWLKDKYGLSWQITPRRLMELLQDPDKEKAHRVANAMLKMQKIDIAQLEEAAKNA